MGEPGLRIDAVQFGGFDQGVGDGCGFFAGLRAAEEVVLAAQSDGAHRAFGGVVVDLEDAVIEIASPHNLGGIARSPAVDPASMS